MAKKLIFILTLLLSGYSAQSQILISIIFGDKLNSEGLEFGLDGGVNFSQMTGMESKNYASNFHLGFYFDIKLKNQFWLNTGVLVKSSQGAAELTKNDVLGLYPDIKAYLDSGSYSQSFGYFNVPLMLKYRLKNHFFIEGGTQMAIMINARLNYEYSFDGVDVTSSADNMGSFNRFDMGLIGGIGYKLRKGTGMNIGLKYYQGMIDITKSENLNNKNRVIYLKVDIPIGKEKSESGK
ncbi:PorT family protein [bacterium SCSIO 12643]|nr:PorT family protein [bacterium SCSIO 12643]